MTRSAIVNSAWPNLVALRDGETGCPLFTFGGLGCNVYELSALASSLKAPGAIFSVEFWEPLDRSDAPPTTIEAMASAALAAIRQVQPRGPYRLLGYSLGGLIAFEVAQALIRNGEEVGALIAIDSPTNNKCWPFSLWFVSRLKRLRAQLNRIARLPAPERLVQVGASLRRLMAQLASRLGGSAVVDPPPEGPLPPGYRRCQQALAIYRPSYYPGRLQLVNSEALLALGDDLGRIWKGLAARIDVQVISGAHLEIVRSDGPVGRVAAVLDDALAGRGAAHADLGPNQAPKEFEIEAAAPTLHG